MIEIVVIVSHFGIKVVNSYGFYLFYFIYTLILFNLNSEEQQEFGNIGNTLNVKTTNAKLKPNVLNFPQLMSSCVTHPPEGYGR